MKKEIEVISLIYKSPSYLNLISSEFKESYCQVDGWDVHFRIVANDPTQTIRLALPDCGIPFDIYEDLKPNDYYLNRVYRCWNYAGFTSNYSNICFVNSDMVFSSDWLTNLLKHHNGTNIPCSRLVESGKLMSGQYGISTNFGYTAKEVQKLEWLRYAQLMKSDRSKEGGLFMPCVFETQRFIESGGYPEGNIYRDGVAGSLNGDVIQSGDDWYFRKLEREYAMQHITVFDSLVYHIQEGEKDE